MYFLGLKELGRNGCKHVGTRAEQAVQPGITGSSAWYTVRLADKSQGSTALRRLHGTYHTALMPCRIPQQLHAALLLLSELTTAIILIDKNYTIEL